MAGFMVVGHTNVHRLFNSYFAIEEKAEKLWRFPNERQIRQSIFLKGSGLVFF